MQEHFADALVTGHVPLIAGLDFLTLMTDMFLRLLFNAAHSIS